MSSGFIKGLMFECLRLSANDFVCSIPPTLGPSSMFSVSLHTASTWLLRIRSFILACRSAFLGVTISDGTQVFNQWQHIIWGGGGGREVPRKHLNLYQGKAFVEYTCEGVIK